MNSCANALPKWITNARGAQVYHALCIPLQTECFLRDAIIVDADVFIFYFIGPNGKSGKKRK